MPVIVLRVLLVLLAVWAVVVFWRWYVSWLRTQQPTPTSPPDDWTEVLESIRALPETRDPPASRR